MNSFLYKCVTKHIRTSPKHHRFSFEFYMFFFDLDELGTLNKKLFFFSWNKKNLYSLYDKDFLNFKESGIKKNVLYFLESKLGSIHIDKVYLLATTRTLGYAFNPVVFYYCYDKGKLVSCVAEVTNTFREKKLYLVPRTSQEKILKLEFEKNFYISPFVSENSILELSTTSPEQRLDVQIRGKEHGQSFFYADLKGERRVLSDWNLLKNTIRYPLIGLQIIFSIHWQALQLWIKKIPYFPKNKKYNYLQEVIDESPR